MPKPASLAAQRTYIALAIAQVVIVVTGGLVRLTGSGLGCPTWPKCTKDSYVPSQSSWQGHHTTIEFGNRMVTFVLVGLAFTALFFAISERYITKNPGLIKLAGLQVAGVFGQAVLGGITVLTKLNPLPVAGHFLLSIALITGALALVRQSRPIEEFAPVRSEIRQLNWVLLILAALVLAIGTLVTGSGPHAGDALAKRFPFEPRTISFLHADLVIAFCGLAVAVWLALRVTRADSRIIGSAQLLIIFILGQGAIGYTQYFTKLPEVLVALHLIGAESVWISTYLLYSKIRQAGIAKTTTS